MDERGCWLCNLSLHSIEEFASCSFCTSWTQQTYIIYFVSAVKCKCYHFCGFSELWLISFAKQVERRRDSLLYLQPNSLPNMHFGSKQKLIRYDNALTPFLLFVINHPKISLYLCLLCYLSQANDTIYRLPPFLSLQRYGLPRSFSCMFSQE